MRVKDLIEQLQGCDPEARVFIPDSHYGEEGSTSEAECIYNRDDEWKSMGWRVIEIGFSYSI